MSKLDQKFNGGDFLVIDKQRSGRPIEVCDNVNNDIIDRDRHTTTRGIAEKLNVSHTYKTPWMVRSSITMPMSNCT